MQDEEIPMERLEAAMAKARAARKKALKKDSAAVLTETAAQVVSPTMPEGDWEALAPISISKRKADRSRLGALMGSPVSTPYDMLRARLLRQIKEHNWKRIAVTSPDSGCGKSTVSANLAFSLARKPELRVVLMDFDMRRPSLAKMLYHKSRLDMSELLTGQKSFADYAVRYGDNLAICLNHKPISNSSEILQSSETDEILHNIAETWKPDVMIFDVPPLMGASDTLGFMEYVDGVLLVAAAEATTISQVDICERELAEVTNVVGTVLNKCRYPDADAGYSAGYY